MEAAGGSSPTRSSYLQVTVDRGRQTPVVTTPCATSFTHSENTSHALSSVHGIPSATMLGQLLTIGPPVIAAVGHEPRRQSRKTPSQVWPGSAQMMSSQSPLAAHASPAAHPQFPIAGSLHEVPAGPGAWHVEGLPPQYSGATQPAAPKPKHGSPSTQICHHFFRFRRTSCTRAALGPAGLRDGRGRVDRRTAFRIRGRGSRRARNQPGAPQPRWPPPRGGSWG